VSQSTTSGTLHYVKSQSDSMWEPMSIAVLIVVLIVLITILILCCACRTKIIHIYNQYQPSQKLNTLILRLNEYLKDFYHWWPKLQRYQVQQSFEHKDVSEINCPGIFLVHDEVYKQKGSKGYHSTTKSNVPYAMVNMDRCQRWWTGTLSHELIELIANPFLTREICVQRDKSGCTKSRVVEPCDPVQDRSCYFETDEGYYLSDYVLPSWFRLSTLTNNGYYDRFQHINNPGDFSKGYIPTRTKDGLKNCWMTNGKEVCVDP